MSKNPPKRAKIARAKRERDNNNDDDIGKNENANPEDTKQESSKNLPLEPDKKKRKTQGEMREDVTKFGKDSLYRTCEDCKRVYHHMLIHTCRLPKRTEEWAGRKCFTIKSCLQSLLDMKSFPVIGKQFQEWVEQTVHRVQRIRVLGSLLFQHYLVYTLHRWWTETPYQWDQLPHIDQNTFKQCLSLVCSDSKLAKMEQHSNPLIGFFQTRFKPLFLPQFQWSTLRPYSLDQTTLQYEAKRLFVNWKVQLQTHWRRRLFQYIRWQLSKLIPESTAEIRQVLIERIQTCLEISDLQTRNWTNELFSPIVKRKNNKTTTFTASLAQQNFIVDQLVVHLSLLVQYMQRCGVNIRKNKEDDTKNTNIEEDKDDDSSVNPAAYLPLLSYLNLQAENESILAQQEERKCEYRPFALSLEVGWIPPHIMLDSTLLNSLAKAAGFQKHFTELFRDFDSRFPSFESQQAKNRRILWKSMQTDGISVSMTYEVSIREGTDPRKRQKTNNNHNNNEEQQRVPPNDRPAYFMHDIPTLQVFQQQGFQRIVTLDTNRRNLFYANARDVNAMKEEDVDIWSPKQIHQHRDSRARITGKEWKEIRGFRRRNKDRERKLCHNPSIQTILSKIPSTHTVREAQIIKRIQYIGIHLDALLSFWKQRCFRRAKMSSFIQDKKAYKYILKKLWKAFSLNNDNQSKKQISISQWKKSTAIVIGDGSFDYASAGHSTTPTTKRFVRELKELGCNVFWIDEFRSSCLCSQCLKPVKPCQHSIAQEKKPVNPKVIQNQKKPVWRPKKRPKEEPDKEEKSKTTQGKRVRHRSHHQPWGVRACSNKTDCNTSWNRDVNSAHAFLVQCLLVLRHGRTALPDVYIRGRIPKEDL